MKKISTDTHHCSGLKDCLDCPYSISDTKIVLREGNSMPMLEIPSMDEGCMDIEAWHYRILTCLKENRAVKIKRIIKDSTLSWESFGLVSIPPWCPLEDDK